MRPDLTDHSRRPAHTSPQGHWSIVDDLRPKLNVQSAQSALARVDTTAAAAAAQGVGWPRARLNGTGRPSWSVTHRRIGARYPNVIAGARPPRSQSLHFRCAPPDTASTTRPPAAWTAPTSRSTLVCAPMTARLVFMVSLIRQFVWWPIGTSIDTLAAAATTGTAAISAADRPRPVVSGCGRRAVRLCPPGLYRWPPWQTRLGAGVVLIRSQLTRT